MYQKDCIFCQISQELLPCYKVWSSEKYMAFLSIFANTKGLTVVMPKEHKSSYIFHQSIEIIQEIMFAAQEVSQMLVNKFESVDRVAVVFEGCGVDHLHVKLFPLHGTKDLEYKKTLLAKVDTQYAIYPGYISTHDIPYHLPHEELTTVVTLLTS